MSPSDTSTALFTAEAHEERKYVIRVSKSHRYFLLAQLYLQACHPAIKALSNLLLSGKFWDLFFFSRLGKTSLTREERKQQQAEKH